MEHFFCLSELRVMNMSDFHEKAIRLQEIRLQIFDLVCESQDILSDTDIEELADRTWLLQIRTSLDSDHGQTMKLRHTMEDSETALFEAANASNRADFCVRDY
jgi:hypothetical protein